MSLREIALTSGVSPSTVLRDLKKTGGISITRTEDGNLLIPITKGLDGRSRPSVRYDTSGRDALIRQLRGDGLTIRAIAAQARCSVGTVHRVLRRG